MDYQFRTVSYRIGEAKILELRVRAQKALGKKFKLRDFHDEVLRDGSMPLAVLEEKIERWIARPNSCGRDVRLSSSASEGSPIEQNPRRLRPLAAAE
jgi:uncharacterized protein DUF885